MTAWLPIDRSVGSPKRTREMDAYVRRFCEVKRPRDVLQFLEVFVYLWPFALAVLFGLYRLGADVLPQSLLFVAIPGLALAFAARVHSATLSPYDSDYNLVEALKVVAMTIGACTTDEQTRLMAVVVVTMSVVLLIVEVC